MTARPPSRIADDRGVHVGHGRVHSTTRSWPARSRVARTFVVAEPLEERHDASGVARRHLQHERAALAQHVARALGDRLGRAVGDERLARLPVAHLGLQPLDLVRRDVRRVRDDEVPRARRKPVEEIARARAAPSRPACAAFARATSSAAGEASIAVTSAPGCSSAIASAIAPLPVPTSSTRGSSCAGDRRERPLDDDLRLRPRDEHSRDRPGGTAGGSPTRRGRTRAARGARGARGATRAPPLRSFGQAPAAVRVEARPRRPEHVREKQLGVEPRRVARRRLEAVPPRARSPPRPSARPSWL